MYYGMYRGIVEVTDETKCPMYRGQLLGRIGIIIPSVFMPPYEKIKELKRTTTTAEFRKFCPVVWAKPCFSPGQWNIPEIGMGVLVFFEGGDLSHPCWIGEWRGATESKVSTTVNALGADAKDTFIKEHKGITVTMDKDGNVTLNIPTNKKLSVTGGLLAEILGTSPVVIAGTEGVAPAPENTLNDWITNVFDTHVHTGNGVPPTTTGTSVKGTTKLKGS